MSRYQTQSAEAVMEMTEMVLSAVDIVREADPQRKTVLALVKDRGGLVRMPDVVNRMLGLGARPEALALVISDVAVAVIETYIHLQIISRHSGWIPFVDMETRMFSIGPREWFMDMVQREILEQHLEDHPEWGN